MSIYHFSRGYLMFLFSLAFLFGDLYLQTFSHLPEMEFIFFLLCISIIFFALLRKHLPYSYLLLAFTLGFTWSAWYAHQLLSWTLPKEIEGKPILATGTISSLPMSDQWQTNFLFSLKNLKYESKILPSNTLIRLTTRDKNLNFRVGDSWQFYVSLKRIHATQNPGSFDFEAFALQKGLRAKGYIISDNRNQLIAHDEYRYPVETLRQRLEEKIQANLPKTTTAPWLMALIIGERIGVAHQDWKILRLTGTNHLMAIAGLHIGMLAGFFYYVIFFIWKRFSYLVLKFPAKHAGMCAALLVALFYSALAGFSLPTQRACMMLSIFIFSSLMLRKINAWTAWSFALILILIFNPLSVLNQSFWLSFSTIAFIIYGMDGRLSPKGIWWKWGRAQWVIGLGLVPFSLLFFQECSLISIVANSIAIPLLGFFILPFCLVSAILFFISVPLAKLLLFIADKNLSLLWSLLTWFSNLHYASLHQVIPFNDILFLTIIAFIFLLFPMGFPGHWLGIIFLFPLIFFKPMQPKPGEIWLTLLDVGQGLSIVIQTKSHVLVYDAGPKYNANLDMGENVVLPYLRQNAINKIDMLVISHKDNDHIGGAATLLDALPIDFVQTSVPEKISKKISQYCLADTSWQWDQVNFKFLYPTKNDLNLNNDSSCVLQIMNHHQKILLTGDIEKYGENRLLNNKKNELSANILIAPHHGSKTSGLKKFIEAVHPEMVLYSTGYRNRYHFPHQDVVNTYDEIHAQQWNTVQTGAIQLKMADTSGMPSPILYRVLRSRYWMND